MIAKRDDWPQMSDAEKVDYLYVQCDQTDDQLAKAVDDLRRRVRLLSDEVARLRRRLDGEAAVVPRR